MKKPLWLNKRVNLSAHRKIKSLLRELNLHTICEESLCPNVSECFSHGVATFMILGDICTRACKFCAVVKGKPRKVDYGEPKRVKEAVKKLNLNYIVITSPTRDDLGDGGAEIFAQTAGGIKSIDSCRRVELLIPDFLGNKGSLKKVANCGADVITHNLETPPRLYREIKKGSEYERSLEALRIIKKIKGRVYTKSGLILGLGEEEKEIIGVFKDLRRVGCDFLTLGQYLPPSLKYYPVKKYINQSEFDYLKKEAFKIGFKEVKSAPYVRSSYLAHTFLIP